MLQGLFRGAGNVAARPFEGLSTGMPWPYVAKKCQRSGGGFACGGGSEEKFRGNKSPRTPRLGFSGSRRPSGKQNKFKGVPVPWRGKKRATRKRFNARLAKEKSRQFTADCHSEARNPGRGICFCITEQHIPRFTRNDKFLAEPLLSQSRGGRRARNDMFLANPALGGAKGNDSIPLL